MKKISLALIICSTFLISHSCILSQSSLNPDSLITGSSYRFVLYNEEEIIGKISRQDSVYINVLDDDEIHRLKKEDIFFVSRNLAGSKYTVKFSLGAGTSIFGSEYYNQYQSNLYSQFAVQLSALFPISEHKGFRVDAGYSRWKSDAREQGSITGSYYSKYDEQFENLYYLKGDFVFGLLSPVKRFNVYGIAGLGLHIWNESEYTSTYKFDSNNFQKYTIPADNNFNVIFSLGGGLGYRITRQLGVYTEIQFNTVTNEGMIFFFWGRTYFPIRAGVTYLIY